MLAAGQGRLTDGGGTEIVFDDATASPGGQRVFVFTAPVPRAEAGARILLATRAFANFTGLEPDFVMAPGMLPRNAGRVCYVVNPPQAEGSGVIDCVAFGRFTGDNGPFGVPTPVTPDNRSLQRVDTTGDNRTDWRGVLQPTPESNTGAGVIMTTLCGNEQVNQGEQCDGSALGGQTCTDFGFASGALRCRQCHVDTGRCSQCGNGALNAGEQCDGTALRGKTCAALGFTGGALACTIACRLSTDGCDPTFFVPGGGPAGPDCLTEWRVTNAGGRPGGNGRAPARQRCKDGDAGCDADATPGTCTFTVGVCLGRDDARLARGGRSCVRGPVESWTLLAPTAASGGADAELAATLLGAVAGLGASSTADGAVTFAPPLDATERCTAPLSVVVPTRGTRPGVRLLRVRTAGAGGRPRDTDTLKLVCAP
jgi:hypothetical protein